MKLIVQSTINTFNVGKNKRGVKTTFKFNKCGRFLKPNKPTQLNSHVFHLLQIGSSNMKLFDLLINMLHSKGKFY